MSLFQVVILLLILIVIPYIMGVACYSSEDSIFMPLVYGYIIQWAVLFLIAVPIIIKGMPLSLLVNCWTVALLICSAFSMLIFLFLRKRRLIKKATFDWKYNKTACLYLGVFILVFSFILYKTIFYVCADGDDAFYISVAQSANISDSMYLCDPYLGDVLSMDNLPYRYALAPFPMWLAIIARCTGLNVAAIAHTIIPPVLIFITFTIYYEFGAYLFDNDKGKVWLYMIFISVWVLFSNVSTSTAETFLLTRSRQGKEALANIIIPFAILICYRIIKRIEFRNEVSALFLLLFVNGFSAALTSVFGNVLLPILYGALMVFMIIKRKYLYLIYSLICCLPSACVFLIYLKVS